METGPLPVLIALWAAYGLGFVWNHFRVRRHRKATPETGSMRSRLSDLGLLLEFSGIGIAWTFRRPAAGGAMAAAAFLLAAASIAFAWWALAHLGRQWRIRAVVTDDHELVVSGPYRIVRHPIYTSLLGMLLATSMLAAAWPAAAFALAIYLAGTEIRIHSEEALLARAFPGRFAAYKTRVRAAYLPYLR